MSGRSNPTKRRWKRSEPSQMKKNEIPISANEKYVQQKSIFISGKLRHCNIVIKPESLYAPECLISSTSS